MILFAVIDIIGSIPIIIGLRQKSRTYSIRKGIHRGHADYDYFFLGTQIPILIGIDVYWFTVAGSLVFLFIALEMVLGVQLFKGETPETTSVVPFGISINCRCRRYHDNNIINES